MKKVLCGMLAALFLMGCQPVGNLEKVEDIYVDAPATAKSIQLALPKEAEVGAMTGNFGTLYFCHGYEISTEITAAGNISETFATLTGFPLDSLAAVQTLQTGMRRYDCAWTAAGEAGEVVGKTVVLDDGSYHYCVTVTVPAKDAATYAEEINGLISSIQVA